MEAANATGSLLVADVLGSPAEGVGLGDHGAQSADEEGGDEAHV